MTRNALGHLPKSAAGGPYVSTVRIQDFLQSTKPAKSKCKPIEPFFREPIARSWPRRAELNMEDGCVLWGNCIIVPAQGRPQVIADFHEAHAGISRMKGFACGCVWRPYMDIEWENAVRSCFQSQLLQNALKDTLLHIWRGLDNHVLDFS